MNLKTKAIILDHMAKVTSESIMGESIKHFVAEAHLANDKRLKEHVECIKSQINDNPPLMEKILGDTFPFFNSLDLKRITA